ncbi:hypothetical protein AVDCRST_MAG92-4495 [uncultured Coleofasciculus sp.]|uniref:Uncharacterized protein n=1 Tax=uncultured Coleofasciculus sp. TaxID=1267456 RepID=A0A6J4K2E2_9CYAN|nr:hypothetical protein AVDCRST_MAG92-4495 [uncultured Coleofasciculus sp.]
MNLTRLGDKKRKRLILTKVSSLKTRKSGLSNNYVKPDASL